MLCASPSPAVAYLWEPFSLLHRPGICAAEFPYWFPYVCDENAAPFVPPIRDMLAFRYRTGAELRVARAPKDLGRLARDRLRFARWRATRARPLLKDPIAVFSSEWLADAFDMDVIVLIRHPAAFTNSLIRLGWDHPFDHFLKQPLLMRDVLARFEGEIRAFAADERPILDQGILLWNLIHHAILGFRERRPGWAFLRLEDVALDPHARVRELYDRLGLAFDDAAARKITETSAAENPEATSLSDHRRDSAASIVAWKRRLSQRDVERIREGVEPIAGEWYSDADW